MSERKVAVISGASVGLRDFPDGQPGLWFGVHWDDGRLGALIAFQGESAFKFIAENKIYAVEHLNGRKCIINDGGIGAGRIEFVSLLDVEASQ